MSDDKATKGDPEQFCAGSVWEERGGKRRIAILEHPPCRDASGDMIGFGGMPQAGMRLVNPKPRQKKTFHISVGTLSRDWERRRNAMDSTESLGGIGLVEVERPDGRKQPFACGFIGSGKVLVGSGVWAGKGFLQVVAVREVTPPEERGKSIPLGSEEHVAALGKLADEPGVMLLFDSAEALATTITQLENLQVSMLAEKEVADAAKTP